MTNPVDTLTIYQRLKSANMEDEAAREIADVFRDVIESNLASKTDLETVKGDLKKELEITKADLEKVIERTRADIIKWVAGMLVAQAAIVATLVKLL